MNPFTPISTESVVAEGELRLIAKIRRWLGAVSPKSPFGIGDDCAVIPPARNHQLVTTDPVVFGRHFDETASPRAVGAKLLKRNLSDIAAMGGKPLAAVISLALGPDTSVAWLRGFYLGLARCAAEYRVKIVGGDITAGPAGFVGAFLTLHGESSGRRVITRAGAGKGDHLYVTGSLGGSVLGHHLTFKPRLAEGVWLAHRREVVSMMDVSDGIAKDLRDLTTFGLAPALDGTTIPISAAARRLARQTSRPALHHALGDGEDFELLIAIRAKANLPWLERDWRKRFPHVKLTRIGCFIAGRKLPPDALRLDDYRGYEHLRLRTGDASFQTASPARSPT